MGFHRATKSKPAVAITESIRDMTTAAINSFSARSATMLRDARRAMRMLVPYKHELTAIADELGCKDNPFQCWQEIRRLKERAAEADDLYRQLDDLHRQLDEMQSTIDDRVQSRAHNVLRELNEAEARIMAHEEAATKARELWRQICGDFSIQDMKPPTGAGMLVWLMSLVEGAEARSKADRATALHFKAACAELCDRSDASSKA